MARRSYPAAEDQERQQRNIDAARSLWQDYKRDKRGRGLNGDGQWQNKKLQELSGGSATKFAEPFFRSMIIRRR